MWVGGWVDDQNSVTYLHALCVANFDLWSNVIVML